MVLKISVDEINQSLKFSAFIAFGVLFFLSLIQIVLTKSLFWQVIGVISGLIFIFLLTFVLIKVLKPVFKVLKQRRKERSRLKRKGVWKVIGDWFKVNLYFKIMAIIWVIILLIALDFTAYYFGLVEDKTEKYKLLANLGLTIITITSALVILNISKWFKR